MVSEESKKKELSEKICTDILPYNLAFFEKILSSSKTNSGFFVGDALTLADVYAFFVWEVAKEWFDKAAEIIDKFLLVKANDSIVSSHEKIVNWKAKRPVTDI